MKVKFNLKEYDKWCDDNDILSHVILYEDQVQEIEVDTTTWNSTWFRDDEVIHFGFLDRVQISEGEDMVSSLIDYTRYLIKLQRNNKIDLLWDN